VKHILIIGDSHVQGFRNPEDPKSDIEYKTIDFGSDQFTLKNKYSLAWRHGKTAWGLWYNEFTIPSDYDVVIIWLGDVDIRAHLLEKQNVEELVERYVTYAKNFFGGKPVYFLEPVPQVRDSKFKTLQPLEDRIDQYNKFNQLLRDFGANVISYRDILPNDILEEEDTHDTLHLKKKYIVQILDKIDNLF